MKNISYEANVNVPAHAKRRPTNANSFSIILGCCALMESSGKWIPYASKKNLMQKTYGMLKYTTKTP